MDVAASKSRDMDVTSFAVAVVNNILAEHLENVRFGIRSKGINFVKAERYIHKVSSPPYIFLTEVCRHILRECLDHR